MLLRAVATEDTMKHFWFRIDLVHVTIVAALCIGFFGCEVQQDRHYQVEVRANRVRSLTLAGAVTDQILSLWESNDNDTQQTLEHLRSITSESPLIFDDSVPETSLAELWNEATADRMQASLRAALKRIAKDPTARTLSLRVSGSPNAYRVTRWTTTARNFVGQQVQHVDRIANQMPRIIVAEDRPKLAFSGTNETFVPWGFNYDRRGDELLEEFWIDEWDEVVSDFEEMNQLGGNCVRLHLQFGRFMDSPTEPNQVALRQLRRLVRLAEQNQLYLNITGLACYDPEVIPTWYDKLSEKKRWDAQAVFWAAVSRTCAGSNAVFCYDLMNEPVFENGAASSVSPWLVGDGLGGSYFVQRLVLEENGRTREEIAKAWVDKMVDTIRKHDTETLVTVGVIPWHLIFYPGAKPIFYGTPAGEKLDFASIHHHPTRPTAENPDTITNAIAGLAKYDVGKPLVLEETSGYQTGVRPWEQFLEGSKTNVDGWYFFYWGDTPEDLAENDDFLSAYVKQQLDHWISIKDEMTAAAQQ